MSKPRDETDLESWRGGGGLYNSQWAKFRSSWIKSFPVCAVCELRGRRVSATVFCDHLRPHKGNLSLFGNSNTWSDMADCIDLNNVLSPMCRECHGAKSGAEKLGFDCKASGLPLTGKDFLRSSLWDVGFDKDEMPIRAKDYVAFLSAGYREMMGLPRR